MSANNLTVDEVATKKIRELIESEELKGFMPIDSSIFGTKKFSVEKLSLKADVTTAVTNLSNQISALSTRVTVNGEQITMLKSKLRGALILKDELTVAQIASMDLSTVEAGWMYTVTDGGTITYVYGGVTKNLKVEQYDEVAWSENSGWIIVGKDKSVDLTPYTPTANLAAVALSNDYNDLTNKPTIPAAQVQANWNQSDNTAVDFIKNKPNLAAVALSGLYSDLTGIPSFATVATSGDYADLANKPTIGNAILTIQKNGTDVDSFSANASVNKTINLLIPTKTSDIQNDSGFITASSVPTKTSDLQNDSGFIGLEDIPVATVYDNGLMPHQDHSKLQGIEAGAQVNVKPDWNAEAGTEAEILNKPLTVPPVAGKVGKYLGVKDGSTPIPEWQTLPSELPDMTGNAGKVLTVVNDNGDLVPGWLPIPSELPSTTGNAGKVLTVVNSGGNLVPEWRDAPTELPSTTDNDGKFLTVSDGNPAWADLPEPPEGIPPYTADDKNKVLTVEEYQVQEGSQLVPHYRVAWLAK